MTDIIKKLLDDKHNLLNLAKGDKIPINKGWMRDDSKTLLEKFDVKYDGNVGIRMGYNNVNNRQLLGLDFDCVMKDPKTGKMVDDEQTTKLKEKYIFDISSEDGMYQSSTSCNVNVMVDITDSKLLVTEVSKLPNRWSQNGYNLELLTGGNWLFHRVKQKIKKLGNYLLQDSITMMNLYIL